MTGWTAAEGLEELHLRRDPATGLVAVVAIHDRRLGPAKGGTRLRAYPDLGAAVADAARLARAMTWKFAVHGLPYGGGKAVVLQDARGASDRALLEARLEAYGAFVERLGGAFGTGPDLGVGPTEVAVIQRATAHAVGGGAHGDASAATAAGVRVCLERALDRVGGELAGAVVAVQGVGAVGGALAAQLAERGARLLVADVDPARAEAVAATTGGRAVDPAEVLFAQADAVCPCATGDVLSAGAIPRLRCRVVAGGANDQLAAPVLERARALAARDVLYVPDFVANGGGAVALTAGAPTIGPPEVALAERRVGETLERVLARAEASDATPYEAAVAEAEAALASA